LQQPVRLTGAHRKPDRIYAYAKGEVTSAPFYEKCQRDPSWTTVVTEHGGHDQMVDDPVAVTDILLKAGG
jgi:hypothetical protein